MRVLMTATEYETLQRVARHGPCPVERTGRGGFAARDRFDTELDAGIVQRLAAAGLVDIEWALAAESRFLAVLVRVFGGQGGSYARATRAGRMMLAHASVPDAFDSLHDMVNFLGARLHEHWECMRQAGGCGRVYLRVGEDDCCAAPAIMRCRVYPNPSIDTWRQLQSLNRVDADASRKPGR